MEGQMTIFDFLESMQQKSEKVIPGQLVSRHGRRVAFDELKEGACYIADYSSAYHEEFKVVYVRSITGDAVQYADSPKGIGSRFSWDYCCQSRRDWINSNEKGDIKFYELAEGQIGA